MEDVYVTYLESHVPTLQNIREELERRKIRVTEAQIRRAIQISAITCKDSDGNYTGSKRMLLTPFHGKSDLDIIRGNLGNVANTEPKTESKTEPKTEQLKN